LKKDKETEGIGLPMGKEAAALKSKRKKAMKRKRGWRPNRPMISGAGIAQGKEQAF